MTTESTLEKISLDSKYGVPVDLLGSEKSDFVLLATSIGYVLKFHYAADTFVLKNTYRPTENTIRKLLFLYSEDQVLIVCEKELLILEDGNAKPLSLDFEVDSISSVAFLPDKHCLFLGTETGDVIRCVKSNSNLSRETTFDHHDDYISSMLIIAVKKLLLVASGDGCLSIINIKTNKLIASSKNFEDDITTMVLMPSLGKVFLGFGMGTVKAIKWNFWGSPCDRLKSRFHGGQAINDLIRLPFGDCYFASASSNGSINLILAEPLTVVRSVVSLENEAFEKLAVITPSECQDSDQCVLLALVSDEQSFYYMKTSIQKCQNVIDSDKSGEEKEEESSGSHDSHSRRKKAKAEKQMIDDRTYNLFEGLD